MKMKGALLLLFCACSADSGGNTTPDGSTPEADAPPPVMDAPPSNIPAMITLRGTTSERGLSGTSMTPGVTVAAYRASDESTPIATTTSNAQGEYELMIPTNNMPVDGYIKATKANYLDIYLYPAAHWVADDLDGGINMMTPGNRDLLDNFAGGNQMDDKGLVGVGVFDAQGNPVAGATISATPGGGTVRYMGANGLPSASATETSTEGVGFVFNAPANVTLTATKAGMTFHAHTLKARPGAFTTTSVAP